MITIRSSQGFQPCTRESGQHRNVIDISRGGVTLCVCVACGLTWEEGGDRESCCPGKFAQPKPQPRPHYIIRAWTTTWVYWTADGWDRTDASAVKFLTLGDALAVINGILRPFDFNSIQVHEVQP